jgi:hypothetical protein
MHLAGVASQPGQEQRGEAGAMGPWAAEDGTVIKSGKRQDAMDGMGHEGCGQGSRLQRRVS